LAPACWLVRRSARTLDRGKPSRQDSIDDSEDKETKTVRDAVSPTDLGRITAEEIASQPDCWTQAHAQAITAAHRVARDR
jgi:hypothetical protein